MTYQRKEIIGNATLYLGDCLEILPMLDPVIDMVFTDPPYGHKNNDGDLIHNWEKALGRQQTESSSARPIVNDGAEADDIFKLCINALYRLMRSNVCCCCCCGGGGPDPMFARWSLWLDEVFTFKQMIIWDKGPMGMGWHYRRSYETVLVAQKGDKANWYDETDRVENIIRPSTGIQKIIPTSDDHPTPKPPSLAAHFARLHSRIGDTILDPFMGAGSTGVGVLSMGRKFIGIEIDAHWFDIACERISQAQKQLRMFA